MVLSAPAGPVGGVFAVTATFSEDVTGLGASDFTLDNATASALVGSGTSYTLSLTPDADGTVRVDLPAGSATDTAGNTNAAAAQLSRTADLTRPTVVLSAPAGPVGGVFAVTATFSEDVTGLGVSDFTLDNATASALVGSGTSYTLSLTPDADGTVRVDLPAGSATDTAGNTNAAAAQLSRTADLTRPTVVLSAPAGPVGGVFAVTATFSEDVTGLGASDFTLDNATASALVGSGTSYTLSLTPDADGTVRVDLPAGSATDTAGNTNAAAAQLSRTADLTRPTVVLSAPAGPVGGVFAVTATFSEDVTGLGASDFTLDNATASALVGSGTSYTLSLTPDADGTVRVDLPAGSATDPAGNTNAAAAQLSRTADLTRPTVVLSAPAGPVGGVFAVTATFSEDVTGLGISDFTLDNATASALVGSGTSYTLSLTPDADGTVRVDLPAGSATDTAGNTNTAAAQLSRTAAGIHNTAPIANDDAYTLTQDQVLTTPAPGVLGNDTDDEPLTTTITTNPTHGTLTLATDGSFIYTPTAGHHGTDTFRYTAHDPFGSTDTATVTLTTKAQAPSRCTITGTPGNDVLRGTPGDDVICGRGGRDTIHGGPGDDTIYGGPGRDTLRGGRGADTLYGGTDHDTLHGGPGHDTLGGGPGLDTLHGGPGHDTLRGGRGHDALYGGSGNDDLRGGPGHDILRGGRGNDRLAGGRGTDQRRGRATRQRGSENTA